MTSDDLSGLGEFRARLRAARGKSGQGMTIHGLAVAIGAPGITGVAPVLSRRTPRPVRREAAAGALPLSPSPVREAVLTETAKRGPGMQMPPAGFRAVLSGARREAAQSRDRRARERVATYLPPRGEEALRQAFAPVRRNLPASPPDALRGQQAMGGPEFALPAVRLAQTMPGWRGRGQVSHAFATEVGRGVEPGAGSTERLSPPVARPAGRAEGEDLAQALGAYFFRQSRLPPAGGTGFDPRLTPAWAGVKIPG